MELIFKDFSTWLQGMLFILVVYHTISYFFTKDKAFAIYAGYLFLVILYLIRKTSNDSSRYLAENYHEFFKVTLWIVQVYYWMLYSWFSIYFLNLKSKDKKLAKQIKLYIFYTTIFSTIFFLIDYIFFNQTYMSKFFMFLFTPVSLFIVFFFLKAMYEYEDKINKFFVIGLIFFLGFSVISLYFSIISFYAFGFVKPIHIFMIGILLEAITISIGLGYKYHIYRQERDEYNLLLVGEFKKNEKLKDELNLQLSQKLENHKVAEVQALYEKQINELKLTSLLSQMNPHFIFNALNSIKLYIINSEPKIAAHYLNKFSKLIRKILEASTSKEFSLQEELETLDLYITLENIRFSDAINFNIKVDENLNLKTIKVPPLILQPFIENAIWHGLSSKKRGKKILISIINFDEKHIQIVIEDNGIGRKAAAKIKAEKTIKRKSVGINLTKERLTNFVKNYTHKYSIIYEDLKDENNNATGTKVILTIPLF